MPHISSIAHVLLQEFYWHRHWHKNSSSSCTTLPNQQDRHPIARKDSHYFWGLRLYGESHVRSFVCTVIIMLNFGCGCLWTGSRESFRGILPRSLWSGISRKSIRARGYCMIPLVYLSWVGHLSKKEGTLFKKLDYWDESIAVLHFPEYLFLIDDHFAYFVYLFCCHFSKSIINTHEPNHDDKIY